MISAFLSSSLLVCFVVSSNLLLIHSSPFFISIIISFSSVIFLYIFWLFIKLLYSYILLLSLLNIFAIITLSSLLGRLLNSTSFNSSFGFLSVPSFGMHSSVASFCLILYFYFYMVSSWIKFLRLEELVLYRRHPLGASTPPYLVTEWPTVGAVFV